jgi:hypothetical protein
MNCIRKVNRRVAALGLAVASMTPAQYLWSEFIRSAPAP